MSDLLERAVLEGEPVNFKLVASTTVEGKLTLETSNVDIIGSGVTATAPFAGKMLLIVGYEILQGTAEVLEYLKIDGKSIVNGAVLTAMGYVAADKYQADGEQVTKATSGNSPKLKDLWGVPFIPCRESIALKSSAGAATITVIVKAFVMDNMY
jgi:hypothetical protein